ncbi:MAG: acyl-CoA thioesterase [Kiritimatiellia bacterium]|nr:acyl-CoA thioesterase [Lentisphaerota bacterium]
MNNYVIVRPEHLNHQGYLFGGVLLKWVDEFAWIAAALEFPGCTLVTIAMDHIVFRHRVICGSILRCTTTHCTTGTTSVTYKVDVFADAPGATVERKIFSTNITFVNLDEKGAKRPLPQRRPRAGAPLPQRND